MLMLLNRRLYWFWHVWSCYRCLPKSAKKTKIKNRKSKNLLDRSIFLYLGQIFWLVFRKLFFAFNFSLFSFLFLYNFANSILFMISNINIFNIISTICAFLSFTTAKLIMLVDFVKGNFFWAKLTNLWFLTTTQIMTFKSIIACNKSTLFACYFLVFLFFVIFFICLGHAHIALIALVILSRASNIMHTKSGNCNLLITYTAKFSFFSFTFHIFFDWINWSIKF